MTRTYRLLDATFEVEAHHFWFRGLRAFSLPLITRALAGVDAPKILDCGCGTGANLRRLSAYGQTFGFDIVAGQRYAAQYGALSQARASITEIPFRRDAFDLVTAFDVFSCLAEHDVLQALNEIRRVLKPGGALLLNTAAMPFLRGSHAVFGQEVHRTTRRRLRTTIETAGFIVGRMTYTNMSLFPLMVAVRVTQRLLALSSPEESGIDIVLPPRPINVALSRLLEVEAWAARYVDMPVGSSLLGLVWKPR